MMSAKARSSRGPDGRCRNGLALVLAAVLAAACAGPASATAPDLGPAPATEPVVAAVVLNGATVTDGILMHPQPTATGTTFWTPRDAATAWRIATTGRASRDIGGVDHVALCSGEDRCVYDGSSALLALSLADTQLLPLGIGPVRAVRAEPGADVGVTGVINYDLSAWHSRRGLVSALLDGRLHTPFGHGSLRSAGVASEGRARWLLVQPTWQIDDPRGGWSAQAGSIVVPDTRFGLGVPLTGLRIGSNARLLPPLAYRQLPIIEGRADRALRTDIFLDGMYRQTAQVPYGPFQVELLPTLPGRGEADLVTTDTAGVQTRLTVPYYVPPAGSLADGADVWSVDTGAIALDGRPRLRGRPQVLSAAWRRGVGAGVTLGGQLLAARDRRRFAFDGDRVDPRYGVTSASLVLQTEPGGTRSWVGAGHEFLSRQVSVSVNAEMRLGGCAAPRTAGADAMIAQAFSRPCRRAAALAGAQIGPQWSTTLSANLERGGMADAASVLAAGVRWTPAPRSELALNLQHVAVPNRRTLAVAVTWTRSLDAQVVQTGLTRFGSSRELGFRMQSLPRQEDADDGRRWQVGGHC